jgi:glycopeptide antibiotics resistance protein
MFIVYIAAAGCFTGMGSIYDAFRGIQLRGDGLHLIPFADAAFRLEHLLNIALFIPFGFLLPLAWPQAAKLRVTLLFGVSFSLLIELSQLLNHRVTDTDDLLMNACGCLLGWAAFRLFVRIVKRKPPKTTGSLWEPGLYLVVMLLGRLLLFNGYGLSMILMRL